MSDIALKQPGVESADRLPGPVDQRLHQQLERRHRLRRLKPFEERKTPDLSGGAIAAAAEPEVRRHPGRLHRDLPAAAGAGPRHHRRLQAADRGPRRRSATRRWTRRRRPFMAKAQQAPELAGVFSSFQVNVPQLYADIDRTKARQLGVAGDRRLRHDADLSRLALRQRLQPVRPHLLRCACRPTRRSARAPRTSAQLKVRSTSGEMVPLSALLKVDAERRARARDALQRLPVGRHQRRRRRPASRRARRRPRSNASPPRRCRKGIGFEWTELTYQEILAGNSAHAGVPARDPARLPGAGRAVREPDAAAGDHPDRADGPAGRDDRRLADRRRQQHLHADRPDRAGRAVGQERDPDRRVRARARVRRPHAGRRPRSRPAGCGCGRS